MSIHSKLILGLSEKLKSASKSSNAEAAVAVLLRSVGKNSKILLVRRTENPLDLWSGQIAFPGGKRDPEDRNLKETVMRETFEETRINLSDARFLGSLDDMRSTLKPTLGVSPFVFLLEREPEIGLNSELEAFMWVLLYELRKS
ncbi:MAG: CoA pyrophosphatase [Candidatus Bathyarchaeota archaeon]|nr:MAG: CoA pyrophosphatase [Candidatus Bathyarchaeota archaeon]